MLRLTKTSPVHCKCSMVTASRCACATQAPYARCATPAALRPRYATPAALRVACPARYATRAALRYARCESPVGLSGGVDGVEDVTGDVAGQVTCVS
jgi:hypothetical protein